MATIIVGNMNNLFLEEMKKYLEDKIDCKVSIAGDKLVGSIDDTAVRLYTNERMNDMGNKWLDEVFMDEDYRWE